MNEQNDRNPNQAQQQHDGSRGGQQNDGSRSGQQQQNDASRGGQQQAGGQQSSSMQQGGDRSQSGNASGQQNQFQAESSGQLRDQIRQHMNVIDANGQVCGTVDSVDGERVKLTRSGSSDGQHHWLDMNEVAGIEGGQLRLRQSDGDSNWQSDPAGNASRY
jgi:hypothetical protein